MKNIVLIDHEPFTRRRKELFYIDEFIRAGFNVQVWDLSRLISPGMKLADELEEEYAIKCSQLEDVEDLLQKSDINNTVFILEIYVCWENRKILKLLSDYHCYSVKIEFYGNIIPISRWENNFSRIVSMEFYPILKNLMLKFLFYYYNYTNKINIHKKVFSSFGLGFFTDRINHPDYEKYREITKKQPEKKGRYIVFLDNYFPLHPDFKYFRSVFFTLEDAEAYQASLRRFFSFLEMKYDEPVIIAAHPKADYKGNEFGNRKIIKYKTAELVAAADLVVCHASNSISYVVLADKPLVIISTNGYESYRLSRLYLRKVAETLGKEVYNLDQIRDFSVCKIEKIQKDIRRKYIYAYLTSSESENKKNVDILAEKFVKL